MALIRRGATWWEMAEPRDGLRGIATRYLSTELQQQLRTHMIGDGSTDPGSRLRQQSSGKLADVWGFGNTCLLVFRETLCSQKRFCFVLGFSTGQTSVPLFFFISLSTVLPSDPRTHPHLHIRDKLYRDWKP